MTESPASGGLIGAASRLGASIQARSSNPVLWIVRFVLTAGFLLVLKKARTNPEPIDAAVVLLLGCAALLSEYHMGKEAVKAWFDRSPTRLAATIVVYCAVFGYAVLQWTGTAAEMESDKAGLHKARHYATVDSRGNLAKANEALDQAQSRLKWMDTAVNGKAVRDATAAQADLDNAKAHRFWKTTDECRETKGPQTREFCGMVAAWKAEKALAGERAVLLAEIPVFRKSQADASAAARDTPVAVSEDRSDLRFLTKYGNMSEQAAMDLSAAWKILIISLLAPLLGMMVKSAEYRDLPRKPWGFGIALFRGWAKVWKVLTGRDMITNNSSMHIHGMQFHQMMAK